MVNVIHTNHNKDIFNDNCVLAKTHLCQKLVLAIMAIVFNLIHYT